ncbi:MAG: dihydrolipoyl dehydrogenase, partial [Rikenellaceae bacterium]
HVLSDIHRSDEFGIGIDGTINVSFEKIIERSRTVAQTMSKGVQFLLKKNNVEIVCGTGKIEGKGKVEVTTEDGEKTILEAKDIIIATGARARQLPAIPIDNQNIITYRKALTLEKQPESMVVVGSGAIGVELASFYHEIGTKVTVVEYLPNIVPLEDEEVSKYLERAFRKAKLPFMTGATVTKVDVADGKCTVHITTAKGEQTIQAEKVLSAVGVAANIENIGLEENGIKTERGKIIVDQFYKTNIDGIFAIGDVIPTPALAHVASAEAICCIEHICGLNPKPIDYSVVPSCVYTQPEIASIGMKEKEAIEKGHDIRVGKFPYTASGKATAMGNKDGFIKLIFDKTSDKLLGAHFIGTNVTEMIMEAGMSITLGATAAQIIGTIHPHPTLSEAVMEAAAAAHNEVIHL